LNQETRGKVFQLGAIGLQMEKDLGIWALKDLKPSGQCIQGGSKSKPLSRLVIKSY